MGKRKVQVEITTVTMDESLDVDPELDPVMVKKSRNDLPSDSKPAHATQEQSNETRRRTVCASKACKILSALAITG